MVGGFNSATADASGRLPGGHLSVNKPSQN